MNYTFLVTMVNSKDVIEVDIAAESENARDAFFRKFLIDKEEMYFLDSKTKIRYNKKYIYNFKLKGE